MRYARFFKYSPKANEILLQEIAYLINTYS